MQTLSFVPINLHRCWPREWKHSIDHTRSNFHEAVYTPFLYERPIFELSLDRSYFLGSFSQEMFLRMFLSFNNGNLITFKLHIDKIRQWLEFPYKWIVQVQWKRIIDHTHNRNVLKEKTFTRTLIPWRTLCNSDFLDLGKLKQWKINCSCPSLGYVLSIFLIFWQISGGTFL